MPDPITTPSSTPAPANDSPSPLNIAQLASLTKTEEICRVALLPAYLATLTELEEGEVPGEDDITETGIRALLADCATTRNFSGSAAQATTAKVRITAAEAEAQETLFGILRQFQARARQKHLHKNPAVLGDYGIGEELTASRDLLEQYAASIHQLTATDKLPKITESKRLALQNALTAYKESQTAQGSGQSNATQLRTSRDTLLASTVAGRMKIQFAADAEWPHLDPANHATRMQFQLPANRPFVG